MSRRRIQVPLPEDDRVFRLAGKLRDTVVRHEFEDGRQRLLKELRDFVEAADHLVVLADGTRHAVGEGVAEGVVDVEFAGGAGSEEGVV